jgi:hypothetical protein
MALKLQTNFKGLTAEYWKILRVDHDYKTNQVVVRLALYKDQATRETNIDNFLDMRAFIFDDGDLTREELYPKIKESKIVDGAETNEFVKAIDV